MQSYVTLHLCGALRHYGINCACLRLSHLSYKVIVASLKLKLLPLIPLTPLQKILPADWANLQRLSTTVPSLSVSLVRFPHHQWLQRSPETHAQYVIDPVADSKL